MFTAKYHLISKLVYFVLIHFLKLLCILHSLRVDPQRMKSTQGRLLRHSIVLVKENLVDSNVTLWHEQEQIRENTRQSIEKPRQTGETRKHFVRLVIFLLDLFHVAFLLSQLRCEM